LLRTDEDEDEDEDEEVCVITVIEIVTGYRLISYSSVEAA